MPDAPPDNLQQFLPNQAVGAGKQPTRKHRVGTVCRECKYDLRGILEGKSCPECGAPTQTAGTTFQTADLDRTYLQRKSWGLRLLVISNLLIIFPPALSVIIVISLTDRFWMQIIGLILLCVGGLCLYVQPNSTSSARSRPTKIDVAVLVGSLGALALMSVAFASSYYVQPPHVVRIALFLHLVFLMIAHTAICLKCQILSDQMQDEPMGRVFFGLIWVLPASGIIGIPVATIMIGGMIAVTCLASLLISFSFYIVEIVFTIYLLRLSNRFAWVSRYQKFDLARVDRLRRTPLK